MHRTLWRYIPAATDGDLRELERLRALPPEERDVLLGGTTVRARLSVVAESPCDGVAAVGVELSFPGALSTPGTEAGTEAEAETWSLCGEYLARLLEDRRGR